MGREEPTVGTMERNRVGMSVVGGHAVGDFADILVGSLTAAGYSEMIGALLLAVFACAGAYAVPANALGCRYSAATSLSTLN